MSEIKRIGWHGIHGMQRDASGEYVLHPDHEAEVARLRAEVEAYRKDAERWQHARKLLTVDDIFERQTTLEVWNNIVSEVECERADKAIDLAMGASA